MVDVIRQRQWTEPELYAEGFNYYPRRKQIVMARELPASEAPMIIQTKWDTLVATAGYMICYNPGVNVRRALPEYDHWPVRADHFSRNYHAWDEPGLSPSAKHLMLLGCKPYYKYKGAWAKRLTAPAYIQSIESSQNALIPAGAWLLVEMTGERWHVSDEEFRKRYQTSAATK